MKHVISSSLAYLTLQHQVYQYIPYLCSISYGCFSQSSKVLDETHRDLWRQKLISHLRHVPLQGSAGLYFWQSFDWFLLSALSSSKSSESTLLDHQKNNERMWEGYHSLEECWHFSENWFHGIPWCTEIQAECLTDIQKEDIWDVGDYQHSLPQWRTRKHYHL